MATNRSVSKRYERMPFLYWWDVWDGRKEVIRQQGELVLIQRDTGRKARVKAESLLPLLTEGRRTTRGRSCRGHGNWGLYVRPGRIDEIEIVGSREAPAFLVIAWT